MAKKVRIFSNETCPHCKMAKDFLKENGIEFENLDVAKDDKAAEEMVKLTGQLVVPVIQVDDEVVIGFDKDKLKKLLDIK